MIEVENLTKYFGTVTAIEDVSFTVEKGEILGFLGPNAAGKTTTMRILTCFMPPSKGRARVAGYDVSEDSIEVRRRIGYLPETVSLYDDMSVSRYLQFVAQVKDIDRRVRDQRIAAVMEQCDIADVAGRYIGKLSRGYRQRVGLAQALLGDPEVLILDEPTIGLDPKQILEIRQLIKNLAGDRTIILCTHILPEVSMICQRVIIINEGRIVAVDTPENLTARLQKSAQISLQIEGPSTEVKRALSELKDVQDVQQKEAVGKDTFNYLVESAKDVDVRRALSAAVIQKGWGLLEMRPIGMSLEDIFIKLVTEEEAA